MSAVDHRRRLHRIPELDNQLPETIQYVRSVLEPLGCKVFSPVTGSVCAWFDAGRGDTVAFRADMDALPVPEETGLPYASEHPGCMHACGHDGRRRACTIPRMRKKCKWKDAQILERLRAGSLKTSIKCSYMPKKRENKSKKEQKDTKNFRDAPGDLFDWRRWDFRSHHFTGGWGMWYNKI